ncbi:hypothetical protein AWB76_03141 [Caballeronia temeraria]|uniref:Uncharacterized protein n=1 Tax=Caballeronia temeraria TaxID=1777137 RepID=A0A158AVM8_9BURK|nr:hypothetical protein [Caballeronia temeraria]SAK61914.1 hypothetical protein AWB76_03141 [Caballeronia temeraria]
MQKKRLFLAAAIMSMSLIVFMSMNSGPSAAGMFSITRAAPQQMYAIDSIVMFEQ